MQTLFWRLLNISAKIIKIDLYNSELYRFKVGAFFETQCTYKIYTVFRKKHPLTFSFTSP